MTPGTAAERLRAAADHLNALGLYDRPIDPRRVRVIHAPWFFRLPQTRRFDGYALPECILLRRPLAEVSDELLRHELCHVWQMRNRGPLMPLSYTVKGYWDNPYEREARWASMHPQVPAARLP